MSHLMPTDSEIRERIESIKDEKHRLAFKYQYLIAGRISEVCGKYSPMGDDVTTTDFDGETAIMFTVKTAKRKGRLRPVALPLRVDYEPWADEVRKYFASHRETYPFKFAEKWSTSVRYMQWKAEEAFKDLEWPMEEYSKSIEIKLEPKQILDEGVNQRNQEVYKVLFVDGETRWLPKIGENKVRISEKIEPRWRNITSHVMRKRRAMTLLYDYEFDGVDLGIYGGWTLSSQAEEMPPALKSYLYLDPSSTRESVKLLKKMANRYFKKLCKSNF